MNDTQAPLWTLAEVMAATGGALQGVAVPELALTGVSIDSRTLRPGDLFVAIRGERHDGHAFIASAFEQGARLALVEAGHAAEQEARQGHGPLLVVPDTLKALEALGRAARARSRAHIIAVTGSVGKTGSKEMLRLALAPSGAVHASEKSYNNHWGVPLTLARLPREARFGVFEVGMNHPGEITPLSQMIRPHTGIITTVAPVHLGFFASVEEIARAKAELFAGMDAQAVAVLNADNAHFELLRTAARSAGVGRCISFGAAEGADFRLTHVALDMDGSQVRAHLAGRAVDFRLGAPGRHIAINALAVLAAVSCAGADLDAAVAALAEARPPEGRGVRQEIAVPGGGRILLIDESYNANPASMAAALASLQTIPRRLYPRRIAVLGDMLELGEDSPRLHAELAAPVEAGGIDRLFACGPHMRELYDTLPEKCKGAYAPGPDDLEDAVISSIKAGDVVMVKGSLGSRMGRIVEAIRGRFVAHHA